MIPAVVHQIWKTNELPRAWQGFAASWAKHNPDWEYRLWTDRDVEQYVVERYPELREQYATLSYDIQRADLARYLILHGCGGVYADLDLECLCPLTPLVDGQRLIACREPDGHAEGPGDRAPIGNAFLASEPRHPLLEEVVDEIARNPHAITFHQEVLTTTGPRMLTRVIRGRQGGDATILPSRVAYPYVHNAAELDLLRAGGEAAERLKRRLVLSGSWAVHYWANSWIRNLAGELHNPAPHHIPGYRFYQGWDSLGNDETNAGRIIAVLARSCDPTTAGFNTDGFIKRRVRPKIAWTRMEKAAWNEGLYVRRSRGGIVSELLSMIALGLANWNPRNRIGDRR